jgi:tellurium resistance protein TerD
MVNLEKGGNVNLTKDNPTLTKVKVGLGWKQRQTTGDDFDADVQAFVVDAQDKVLSDNHFIFFNNLVSPEQAVKHNGDNRTGEGDGDDETIDVDLSKLPANAQKVVFTVSIHKAVERNQNFGQISDAYIRVIDESAAAVLAKYDLSEDASVNRAMIFGELYRNGSDWKFKAIGQGKEGLRELATLYGVKL